MVVWLLIWILLVDRRRWIRLAYTDLAPLQSDYLEVIVIFMMVSLRCFSWSFGVWWFYFAITLWQSVFFSNLYFASFFLCKRVAGTLSPFYIVKDHNI